MNWSAILPIFFILNLAALSEPARAGYFVTGSMLLDYCQKTDSPASQTFCSGYVAGISDALDDHFFCGPSEGQLSQSKKVVIKYLNEHPEILHKSASGLAIDALKAAFPCKR
jgi:hypothetical protein